MEELYVGDLTACEMVALLAVVRASLEAEAACPKAASSGSQVGALGHCVECHRGMVIVT